MMITILGKSTNLSGALQRNEQNIANAMDLMSVTKSKTQDLHSIHG